VLTIKVPAPGPRRSTRNATRDAAMIVEEDDNGSDEDDKGLEEDDGASEEDDEAMEEDNDDEAT
jgi:hypothetical protein